MDYAVYAHLIHGSDKNDGSFSEVRISIVVSEADIAAWFARRVVARTRAFVLGHRHRTYTHDGLQSLLPHSSHHPLETTRPRDRIRGYDIAA